MANPAQVRLRYIVMLDILLSSAWDHVEDIVQLLKTAFPLLILSLETMLDQMLQRFKPSPEEECYRHVSMLLQDASQVRSVQIDLHNRA